LKSVFFPHHSFNPKALHGRTRVLHFPPAQCESGNTTVRRGECPGGESEELKSQIINIRSRIAKLVQSSVKFRMQVTPPQTACKTYGHITRMSGKNTGLVLP